MDIHDLKKKHIMDVLYISCTAPEKLPTAVSLLEKLFWNVLSTNENYISLVKELEKKIFEEMYPRHREDLSEFQQASVKFAIEKFGLMVPFIEENVGSKHIIIDLGDMTPIEKVRRRKPKEDENVEGLDKQDSPEAEYTEEEGSGSESDSDESDEE